jgi:hypothetical protein
MANVRLSTRPDAPTGIDPSSIVWVERDTGGSVFVTEKTTVGALVTPEFISRADAYTAIAGDHILPDNSAGVLTINLLATPSTGDTVIFRPTKDQLYSVFALTVGRNGSTIMGLAEDTVAGFDGATTEDNIEFEFKYNGTTWVISQTAVIGTTL